MSLTWFTEKPIGSPVKFNNVSIKKAEKLLKIVIILKGGA